MRCAGNEGVVGGVDKNAPVTNTNTTSFKTPEMNNVEMSWGYMQMLAVTRMVWELCNFPELAKIIICRKRKQLWTVN